MVKSIYPTFFAHYFITAIRPPKTKRMKTAEELLKENPLKGKMKREVEEIERKYSEEQNKKSIKNKKEDISWEI